MFRCTATLCCVALALAAGLATTAATAQSVETANTAIPAMPLKQALDEFARRSDLHVVYVSRLVEGVKSGGAPAGLDAEATLQKLLAGTGLKFRFLSSDTVTIFAPDEPQAPRTSPAENREPPAEEAAREQPTELAQVTVTGSHIRGAPPTSPVIDISQEQMIRAGQTDLGEVIRSIPQNFSGGQNPGVALGTGGTINNQNLTGGSALNLRGLGADATLTLLNGRRLSFDGFSQAVDISQIPLAAVDRIEILADGASAIYGSDAVAGVANVILKRDYDGLSTSARFGGATAGGDFEQQYGVVGGTRWSGGGFIVAANYEKSDGLDAGQRSYTRYIAPPFTLLPKGETRSVLLSAHQQLGAVAEFKIDASYNKRNSTAMHNEVTVLAGVERLANQYSISPELTFQLPHDWSVSINGVYGRDKGTLDQATYLPDGSLYGQGKACYCNTIKGWEVDAGGPWFHLPGGDARIALGGGYRESIYEDVDLNAMRQRPEGGRQHSYYVFGEVYLPVVSPGSGLSFAHELSFNLALRHERYNTFGEVTTPKIGVVYAPTADFDLKASWGRSFKTPTLLQQYQPFTVFLFNAQTMGASGYPPTATTLMTYGGNPDLEPERARTWSVTLGMHPASLVGFNADLSYFNVDYDRRVAQGVTNMAAAFTDPAYREFVNLDPTQGQIQDLVGKAGTNFRNGAGVPYDPANVVAIVNNQYVNIASWRVHGLDLSARYDFTWGPNALSLSGNATWLESRQRNSALSPTIDLAGTMYNPPNWHARFGTTWQRGPFVLSAYYNYIGGVTDTVNDVDGDSMQTIDVVGIYHFPRQFDVSVSITNLTNQRPPYLQNLYPFMVNFDSTNYSPVGRYVGVTLTKRWF